MTLQARQGRVAAADASVIAHWLTTGPGAYIPGMSAEVKDLLIGAATSVDLDMPHLELSDSADQVGVSYWDVALEARLLRLGIIGIR